MNKKMKNRVMNHSAKLNQQQGVSTLLFTVLVGVSLTALSVGYISSLKTVQNSATTVHAQTQAQMQAMIGHQALNKYLSTQSIDTIKKIKSGTIKNNEFESIEFSMTSPGEDQYIFDVVGKSGGASSIVRAIFASKTTGGGAFNGSIFGGGLQIGHTSNLQGNQTIQVGAAPKGQSGVVKGNGENTFYDDQAQFTLDTGITVLEYQPTTFLTAQELRPSANYIFYANGTCAKNNLYGDNIYNDETPLVACNSISGIEASGSGDSKKWTIDAASSTIPVGVLWFEGQVDINLKSSRKLVNTIIATGDMKVITTNGGGAGKAYAPYHYYLEESTSTDFAIVRICGSSAIGIPTQYCNNTGTLKALDTEKAKIANILFLSNKNITFDVKSNSPMNLYGNIMGSGGAGGTGFSSGKFTGNGTIDIKGNLSFTGEGLTTEDGLTVTNGTVNVKLNSGDSSGNVTPSKKVMTLSGLRYM